MAKVIYIYGLHAPDDKTIMYVGRSKTPFVRLNHHVTESKLGKKPCPKNKWIASLLEQGKRPEIAILDICTPEEVVYREFKWIAAMRNINPSLKNQRDQWYMTPDEAQAFIKEYRV